MGASENFWADMRIFEGEKDAETLTQKMATGEYVIIGCPMDKLTEEPRNTPLTDQLQVGESISFYKDGELVKTSTILAKSDPRGNGNRNADRHHRSGTHRR